MYVKRGYQFNEADGLTNSLINGYGAKTAGDVIAELRLGHYRDRYMAAINQRQIAQRFQHGMHALDGLGQQTHSIDLKFWLDHHVKSKGECWKDPKFWDKYGKDNPACRIKYVSRHTTIINNRTWKPKVQPRVICPSDY